MVVLVFRGPWEEPGKSGLNPPFWETERKASY